jgi:hypothetical protein
MMRYVSHLRCVARVTLVVGILLLAVRIDSPTWMRRESSAVGTLGALVTCVLPATAEDAPAVSTSVPQATAPDCESPSADPLRMPDTLREAWMTAC